MKKILVTLTILLAALYLPRVCRAKTVCSTGEYGQETCWEEEEEVLGVVHEEVEADLGDVNPVVLGSGMILASGVLFYLSKRVSLS